VLYGRVMNWVERDSGGIWRSRRAKKDSEQSKHDQETKVREFYTVGQLADLLQLTEMTIYRMVNRAELPCYAIGRVKRFRHRDIEEFLDSCRVPAAKDDRPSNSTRPR
jgi:excisionase family DNA binding protein